MLTWLVAGTLDAIAAILQFLINGGTQPERIFKYIARALVGESARSGGYEMVVLGITLHYLVALVWTIIFYIFYRHFSFIRQQIFLSGIIYGLIVWTIMNFVVIPLSRLGPQNLHLKGMIISSLVIVTCIGLPVALLIHKFFKSTPAK